MGESSGSTVIFDSDELTLAESKLEVFSDGMEEWKKSLAGRNQRLVEEWEGNSGKGMMQAGITLETDYQKVIECFRTEIQTIRMYKENMNWVEEGNAEQSQHLSQGTE